MRLSNPFVRAGLAFAAVVLAGGWLWLDWDARLDGFSGYLDRRAAHESGILAGSEWKAMRQAGDVGVASAGGDGCLTDACRTAQAQLGGRWAGIADCAGGDRYRFTDGLAEITSLKNGQPAEVVRRRYRVVTAAVTLRPLRGPDGKPIDRSVAKLPGDIEVFTIGRSSYVRRIFRAADADTLRLVLVEQRAGRAGPPSTLLIEGRPPAGGAEVSYRRCPAG
jgi:hypothetical protein